MREYHSAQYHFVSGEREDISYPRAIALKDMIGW